jgi:peroxiredoxin
MALLTALAAPAGCSKDADETSQPPAGNPPTSVTSSSSVDADNEGGEAANDPSTGNGAPSSTSSDLDAAPEIGSATAPPEGDNGAITQPGNEQPAVEQPGQEQEQPGHEQPAAQPPAASAIPQPPPPAQVFKPEVILSQYHAQTCVIGVGDLFPSATLPDLDGNPRELTQLYGDRMTIILFWNAKAFYAREQFTRIMHECHKRYGALGVRVVAINVGDSPEVVQELATKHGVTIPCLLDADRKVFAQAATDLLPRTYLLDAGGRVVWFDLEYSRSQRLELHNAVYYQLKQNGA